MTSASSSSKTNWTKIPAKPTRPAYRQLDGGRYVRCHFPVETVAA